jgi:sorting nexin-8
LREIGKENEILLMDLLDQIGSLWHELRVVMHNRENALLTQLVQSFAREERDYSHTVVANWESLAQAVESMPFE